MTNNDLINRIPINDEGVPVNPDFRRVHRLLTFYSFKESELILLEKEIEGLIKRRGRTFKADANG